MAMTRAAFAKSLQRGVNTHFGLAYKKHPQEWPHLFKIETSEKAYEEDVLRVGFGVAPVKSEGAGVNFDTGHNAWTARYNNETIAMAFAITEEAEEDNLYGKLSKIYGQELAQGMLETKEIKGANIFNRGHNASYVGGDGVALFSTAHPLGGGGTFSNKLATPADLSEAALEDILIQIDGAVNERGIPKLIKATCLVIPKELRFEAHRILKSQLRVGTANNDTNAINDMNLLPKGVKVNHRLTDTDQWSVLTDCNDGLKHFRRTGISSKVMGDFDSGNMRVRMRERYVFGWTDPRGAYGSEGAA